MQPKLDGTNEETIFKETPSRICNKPSTKALTARQMSKHHTADLTIKMCWMLIPVDATAVQAEILLHVSQKGLKATV